MEVKNLGVIFDSDNSFDNHVAKVCRACYYHLRDLRRIRKFLGVETAILLANAMVSSCLDYCNSLLYGVSKSNIAKLQRVQNALCHIIFRLDKMSHVTPFLKKLHWLPIQHRILFKYKAINLSQPLYLSALIRSSSLTRGNRLSISSAHPNKHIGRRGFAVAAPAEWNKLPQTVRSQQTIDGFRSQRKTYLFRLAYPPTLAIPWRVLFRCQPMPVPGLSLLGLKRIRGLSILRYINPTIIIIIIIINLVIVNVGFVCKMVRRV